MKFAAIGRTEILYRSIVAMEQSGHDVELILTCEPEEFYDRGVDDFRALSERFSCKFISTEDINSDRPVAAIQEKTLPVAISVNWKSLIEQKVLDSFRHGIVNYHAGDLPSYRGNAAMNWALVEGESHVTHTLHFMSSKLDAGPILTKRNLRVTDRTRIGDIYDFATDNVPEMFVDVADGLEEQTLEPHPQPEEADEALRCYPRVPKDSQIQWERDARYLDRLIRASSEPLFGAFTYLGGETLRVWRAHVEEPPSPFLGTPGQVAERRPKSGEVAVITGDKFLVLEEVELGSTGRAEAASVITSSRARLGMDLPKQVQELRAEVARLEERLRDEDT